MNEFAHKSLKRSHFWSHILFSMIAIFSLPSVQDFDRSSSFNQTYQNQSLCVKTLHANLNQCVQMQQTQVLRPDIQMQKRAEFQPHLVELVFASHAPIRGSPLFS